jgi:hypothetical protein
MMRYALAAILVITLAFRGGQALAQASTDGITLRTENVERAGRIIAIDDAGVTIRLAAERDFERLYVWDQVRSVRTTLHRPDLAQLQAQADKLWRARTRLQRGDTVQAQLLFGELFPVFRGRTSEAALIVSEGLLRCQLAHGENERAIVPALECLRLHRAKVSTDRYVDLAAIFDADTSLCMQLPPAWGVSRTLASAKVELEKYQSQGDPVVAAVAELYLVAIRRHMGETVTLRAKDEWPEHAGIALLVQLLEPSDVGIDVRQQGIERWRHLIANDAVAAWAQPWVRYAIGDGMLRSTNARTREEGVIELLHVPVRHAAAQPYLAGLALWRAGNELSSSGDVAGTEQLLGQLRMIAPNHPLLRDGRIAPPRVEAESVDSEQSRGSS